MQSSIQKLNKNRKKKIKNRRKQKFTIKQKLEELKNGKG